MAQSSFLEVAFKGDLGLIKEFYELLGVQTDPGGVIFRDFQILFVPPDGSPSSDGPHFQIVVAVDGDLDDIEAQVSKKGGTVTDSGFDVSGPFITARDPAGLTVRIYLTPEAMARAARKHV